MARLIRVETCEECPFGEKGSNAQGDWYLGCTKKLDGWGWNEPVSDIFIPDWCPLEEERGWVPVGDRLPEEGRIVPVVVASDLKREVTSGVRLSVWGESELRWFDEGERPFWFTVTHWLDIPPLPALPQEASDDK